jgi:hypothetical protein
MKADERGYWLMVVGDTNCELLAKLGRPFYAVNNARVARGVQVGDRCVLYRARTGKGLVGIYEVTAEVTNTPTRVGVHTYSTKIPWKPLLVCEEDAVPLTEVAAYLKFIKNKKSCGTYFQTILRRLTHDDFSVIEHAVGLRSQRTA